MWRGSVYDECMVCGGGVCMKSVWWVERGSVYDECMVGGEGECV